MKNKPNKYGIRLECHCDVKTGVILEMEVYSGSGNNDNTVIALVDGLLRGTGVEISEFIWIVGIAPLICSAGY